MKLCAIGLPTSAMFASHNCQVVGVNVKQEVVDLLNQGHIHIEEPGLEEAIKECVKSGNFRAAARPEEADTYIISVPTPNNQDSFVGYDLTYMLETVKSLIPCFRKKYYNCKVRNYARL